MVCLPMLLVSALQTVAANAAPRPHITFILADDLGFYDTKIYNPDSPTPFIANLSASGIRLDHHYVFRYCSPTRRSFLTGRFPNHITTVQPDGDNLCSDFLPLAFQILPQKLALAGYKSHICGKGHWGYQTTDHLPINRGFESHVGFLGGGEQYYHGLVLGGGKPGHDMWKNNAPASDDIASITYTANYFTSAAVTVIDEFTAEKAAQSNATNESSRLFLFFPIQNVHSPYQLPPAWETKSFPKFPFSTYAQMLHLLDNAVENVTLALQRNHLFENTLIIFSADNGGIGSFGNNYPLRGHKHDPWEGGIRATAFVAGGFIPESLCGTHSGAKLVHIADWYATLTTLAGVDPTDDVEVNGTIRPIDSVNVWPMLTGVNTSHPRALTPVTETAIIEITPDGTWWKLITLAGQSNRYTSDGKQITCNDPCLAGAQPDPAEPGRTDPIVNGPGHGGKGCPVCNATRPCLFSLLEDPKEANNVAAAHSDVVARLVSPLADSAIPYVTGHLPPATIAANYTRIAEGAWGDFMGPCYKRRN